MSHEKILVIDDDPDVALATRLTLEGAGYQVVEARSSGEGLEKVKSEHPALIVLDVMMESATAGFHTALKLRDQAPDSEFKEFSKIPIIMFTSVHETTPLRFTPDQDYLPVDVFIEKPIKPDSFLAKVRELIG